jgi:peptide deformylase
LALLEVITYGHPTLRQVAEPISNGEIDHQIIADMIETMHVRDGVGLAAPQVGISKCLIVVADLEKIYVLVNPVLIAYSEQIITDSEGCLSLPSFQAQVARFEKVIVRATDDKGQPIELTGSGLLARALQHEIDHLNGILYIDRADKATLVELDHESEEKIPITLDEIQERFSSLNQHLPELVFDPVKTAEKVVHEQIV